MKSQTVIRLIIAAMTIMAAGMAGGQSLTANYPEQWPIITIEGDKVITETGKNTTKMAAITTELHLVAQMATMLDKWNKEYNDYLKDPTGLAGTIRVGSTLYAEGAALLENIFILKKAAAKNPEGLGASVAFNNLYMETVTLAIRCYRTLKTVITNGGKDNMLNGADRIELLWNLAFDMKELNAKVRRTAISIAYYDLIDVWNKAIEGMIDKNHKQIAEECHKKWTDAYKASSIFQ